MFNAKILRSGSIRKVVAVLLVNSVIKDVIIAMRKIILNKPIVLKKLKIVENSDARPEEIIREAIDKPPPKSINTFHGMFLYQL